MRGRVEPRETQPQIKSRQITRPRRHQEPRNILPASINRPMGCAATALPAASMLFYLVLNRGDAASVSIVDIPLRLLRARDALQSWTDRIGI